MRCDYWFVPNRILFPALPVESGAFKGQTNVWEQFIMGQNGYSGVPWTIPTITVQNQVVTNNKNNTLASMFCLPLLPQGEGRQFNIDGLNCIPFFAYLAIYDQGYRNARVQNPVTPLIDMEDPNNVQDQLREAFKTSANTFPDRFPCLSAKWEMDYFTAATPQPQMGEPMRVPISDGTQEPGVWVAKDGSFPAGLNNITTAGTGQTQVAGEDVYLDVDTNSATIAQLRLAEIKQAFWERVNRIGQKISDFMKGMYGTNPSAGMIQVPKLFGSCFGHVTITEVMTQALTQVSGQQGSQTGDYTGKADLYSNDRQSHRIQVEEHGFLMAILQVNANTSYGTGIERDWRYTIREDYPLDMFAGIGDQEILKEELLFQNLTSAIADNQGTFGYIDRFAEAKFKNNLYGGDLTWGQGLSWHGGRHIDVANLSESYDDLTTINEAFTNSSNTPDYPRDAVDWGHRLTDQFRVLPKGFQANAQEMVITAHVFHSYYVNRQLPYYSVPGKVML